MSFVQNFPFFSIIIAMFSGIVSSVPPPLMSTPIVADSSHFSAYVQLADISANTFGITE